MASREKKPASGKKQMTESSPMSQKQNSVVATVHQSEAVKIIRRRKIHPAKQITKAVTKKVLALSLKAKDKKQPQLSKKMVKVLINKIDVKKNGITPARKIIKKKPETNSVPTEQVSVEKKTKKNITSSNTTPKPIKTDNSDSLSKIDETINSILKQIMDDQQTVVISKPPKKSRVKKLKIETTTPKVATSTEVPVQRDTISETIEDVMKDLTSLLKEEDDLCNKVVIVKKPKEKKLIVKPPRTLEDNITIDASAKHLIDMLDLSVSKTREATPPIRRHSIAKLSDSQNVTLINNTSHSNISKISRTSKLRSSTDGIGKRFSPYNTRSDSPTKKLRNGKPRNMKENLLGGIIDARKRRKRLGSECSSSEKSKVSGYESDSSFSDISANLDNSKKDAQVPVVNGIEDDVKSENLTLDNSSLCSNLSDVNEPPIISMCPKVPEKSILLDIMKQAFNDINIDQPKQETVDDLAVVPAEQFYSVDSKLSETQDFKSKPELAKTETTLLKEDNIMIDSKDDMSLQSPKANQQFVIDEAILQSKVEEIIKSMEEDDFIETTELEQNQEVVKNNTKEEVEVAKIKEINNTKVQENDNQLQDDSEKPNDREKSPPLDTNQLQDDAKELNDNEKSSPLDTIATKESILQALGLTSIKAVEEIQLKEAELKETELKEKLIKPDYTGSLKTVIKINRIDKHTRGNVLKLPEYKYEVDVPDQTIKMKESPSTSTCKVQHQSAQSSDSGDTSSEQNSDIETPCVPAVSVVAETSGTSKSLVIPEKASSFSIHPGRLCKDECSYCYGKFGLFDTPCHIAQMKSVERQDRILQAEKHLMRDSCLCDACYRHVDRKSNTPSYLNRGSKRNSIIAPGPRQNHCHVLSCTNLATHILRRKWIIKMRKSVSKLINIDLDNLGLHSIPICDEHYLAVEHLMICAMCKRRLTRNQIHYLGAETNDLNTALNTAGIPVKLFDKPVVCKLCRYFASLILRSAEDRPDNTANFFRDYRKRLLHFHKIEVMDEEEEYEEPIQKDKTDKESINKKRKRLHHKSNNIGPPVLEPQVDIEKLEQLRSAPSDSNSTGKSRSESPSDYMVDYNTLIPSIAMECGSDPEPSKKLATQQLKSNNTSVHLSSNSSLSVRELFPGEEELGLQCHINFVNTKEKTPEGWEKCSSIIQYDTETKLLWQELQKPYGNQSSFLRHLVLLEKYFRSGDLVLAMDATRNAVQYSEAVQNRLQAYDNIPKSLRPSIRSTTEIITAKDTSSIINAANIPKNTPITITQINNITPTIVNKTRVPPPGLISLHPGTARPKTPSLIKTPHTNKIKIPLTKNWRPNLIPIDPSKKSDGDKKPGYVKVVSNAKPYFITVDDYNRMCAIKKSYDLKQKRLQEASHLPISNSTPLKNASGRKGLIVSKLNTKNQDALVENNTEKVVENHRSKSPSNPVMILPKIPKSLTVIPQTVQQKSSPPLTSNNNNNNNLNNASVSSKS